MKRLTGLFLALTVLASLSTAVYAADKNAIDAAVTKTAAYVYGAVKQPIVDSVGGE